MDEKEIKSNRAWREECESLRARVAELLKRRNVYTDIDAAKEIDHLRARVAELETEMLNNELRGTTFMDEPLIAQSSLKASQGEPVAWMGYGPRSGFVEFSKDKPAPSVMRDFNMRPLYTSAPTIPEGYLLAEKACREFIRKVENGEARSTRSYATMKMAIDLIDAIGWSTKKKWGE